LGRKDGADADGLKYWSEQLASGKATRGSLVNDILNSAHSFKGKADFGWVADLLDNKITVAKTVAVDWGINFNTPEESISKGMAIAAAVTATDYQAALKLVGINSIDIGLTGVAPLETGLALM
jgi:serralysin